MAKTCGSGRSSEDGGAKANRHKHCVLTHPKFLLATKTPTLLLLLLRKQS
jgi:hypothetical protein